MEGDDEGEEYTIEMVLEGEKESVWSDMKPCFNIAETSLDLSAFSLAMEALRECARAEREVRMQGPTIEIFDNPEMDWDRREN